MASRRLQSNKSLIQEVRNSLTMPGSPSAIVNETMDSLTPTVSISPPKHPRLASARSSFHESDNDGAESVHSTRSTRSVFSIFRRPRNTRQIFDDAATMSSTKSWWQKRRFKNPLKRRRKKRSEQQMVADFFDVQSVASAPATRRSKKKSQTMETRSVTSQRSSRSIGFRFLFRRKKIDELESDFFENGTGMIDASEEMCILGDDEEITLGSGLDDSSYYAGSIDDYSVASRDSLKSLEGRSPSPVKKKPKTFLDRIVKRRKRKKRTTHLRMARPDATSVSETTSVESINMQARRSPRRILRKNRSVRSLNDLPADRQLSRWDSGRSLASAPAAPKQPQRRSEPPESAPKRDESLVETKTVQSMRQLSIPHSMQDDYDEDEDDYSDGDDSVLSLLSGLLATWSEEQQNSLAVNGNLMAAQCHVRGILKTSKKLQEQKEVDRQVVFDSIEIREYERIVGDNPSCTRGPPISIGWSYYVLQRCDIEYYENSVRPPPRSKKEFHLAADRRTQLLMIEWQYPEEELQKARREATYVQYCRAKTSFSGSRAAAKEAAFLRKANSRPKQPTPGAIRLTRDLSVESLVSAAMQQQPSRRKSPPLGDTMSIGSSTGTSVTMDLAASSSVESEA